MSFKEIMLVFDFTNMKMHIVWLMFIYGGVFLAMFIDLLSGIHKAKQQGIARTSTGLKRTADKAIKYFVPLLCLLPMDLLATAVTPLPIFSMAYGAYCVACEWLSVLEKSHTKKEMRDAGKTMSIIIENKDDIAKLVSKVIEQQIKTKEDGNIKEDKKLDK